MDLLSEDRALLAGFRQGNPAALERLYWAYLPEVARFLRRGFSFSSGGKQFRFDGYTDPAELQDSLQDTFLAAFSETARRSYDGLHPFGAYLLGIARNTVLGRYRKDLSRLRLFHPEESAGAEAPDEAQAASAQLAPPDEALQQLRLRGALEAFVSGLTAEQREVMRLHFVERCGQRDTATALELNRNRVRKQIEAIRRKLWRHLKREGLEANLPFDPQPREVE